MKKIEIEFAYLEILNQTEQLMVFQRRFNGKDYGLEIILNTALPTDVQDLQVNKVIQRLLKMKKSDVE